MRFFLNNSKTPQDNEMKFSHFYFIPLRHIFHTLTLLIASRCYHGDLFFPVYHIIFRDGKLRNFNNFQNNGLFMLKCGKGGIFRI